MTSQKIPFAIIGTACRLPGANGLENFWKLLCSGASAITRVPESRMNYELYYDPKKGIRGKTYMDQSGLIDYPAFNSSRCPEPRDVAGALEVGHLLMCETAADACRNAGLDPFDLPTRRVGVYVGNNQSGDLGSQLAYSVMVEEAANFLLDVPEFRDFTGAKAKKIVEETTRAVRRELPRYGTGGYPTVAYHLTAAAVSRALGLDAPAMVFDAACSSSLQALAVAARDLALGNTEMAIVGGASFFRVDSLMIFSAAGSGSAKGCCPFCDAADGLIPAEGNVAIVIKTLERALEDGDPIQAVISGIGVSSDGKGKSLWAPSSVGQYEAISRAYESPDDLSRIAYVEAHATSTAVGDLTELNALTQAFAGKFPNGEKRPIGGVKANVGHALEAAGLAGLVKAVLVLQRDVAPPQINCQPFNTKVDWEKLPFYVPLEATRLPRSIDGRPRMAGVNSFGIGGLNVHVALEEAPKRSTKTVVSAPKTDALEIRPAKELGRESLEPIAVIGFGEIFPGARTLQDFAEVAFSGKNVFTDVAADRWNPELGIEPGVASAYRAPSGRGGFVVDYEYDWRKHMIPPKQIENADPLQFMLLDALDAALTDAGYGKGGKKFDRKRTGVLVASSFDADFSLALSVGFRRFHFQKVLREKLLEFGLTDEAKIAEVCDAYFKTFCERMPAILDETGSFTPSSLSSRVTKAYDLMGGAVTTEAGGVGAFAALSAAVNILRLRENDVMFVAAGSRSMGLPTFIKMGLADRLADGSDVRSPLDADGGKTVPGEGTGVFVLKRLSDALRNGDPIRFVIRGVGAAAVSPQAKREQKAEAFRRAISRAWNQTSASRSSVALAETSVATPEVAAAELDALKAEYPNQKLALGSVESQFGDMFAASGSASLIKASVELAERRVPKTVGYDRPSREVEETIKSFQDPSAPQKIAPGSDGSLFASVTGWDPYGFADCVIIEYREDGRYALESSAKSATSEKSSEFAKAENLWRFLRFGASDREGLVAKIKRGETIEGAYSSADVERAIALVPTDGSEASSRTSERLTEAAELLANERNASVLETKLERLQIFYLRKTSEPGKIAFLFSGQGSQYPNMLKGLVERFQPAREVVERIDAILAKLEFPCFEELIEDKDKKLGVDVFRTQLSLLCADYVLFRSLEALGISPETVAGHSYGEFPALVAAGAWDFEQGAKATKIRCDAIVESEDAVGGMTATNADAATAAEICQRVAPDKAFPANLNSPTQTVIGGRPEALPLVESALSEAGFRFSRIAVPRPFHTPLMAPVEPLLRQRLVAVPPKAPKTRFVSSVTNEETKEPAKILDNLARQMTRQVDYIGLVHKLVDEGFSLLVESGPRRALTGLHGKILGASDKVRWFAPDAPGREGGLGLYQLRALCELIGYFDSDFEPTETSAVPADLDKALAEIAPKLRAALIERAANFDVATAKVAPVDPETKARFSEIAKLAGVVPETLVVWLRERLGNSLDATEPKLAVWKAVDEWSNRFETEYAEAAKREAARGSIAKETSAQGVPAKTGAKVETPSAQVGAPSPFISPVAFYAEVSRETEPEGSSPNQKYRRFRLALTKRAFPKFNPRAVGLSGAALIYGDNPTSRALAKRLESLGVAPTILDRSDDPEADAKKAREICAATTTLSLFLVASRDPSLLDDRDLWAERNLVAQGSYAVAQAWYSPLLKSNSLAKGTIVAIAGFGGGFGVVSPTRGIEAGALSGLIKSLDLEAGLPTNFAFRSKIVDFPTDADPEFVVEKTLNVLAANVPYEVETGFLDGERVLTRLVPARASRSGADPRPSGQWVVTGGGRGITAYLALGIAKKYGLSLALIGGSPVPNVPDAWKKLDAEGLKALRDEIVKRAESKNENPQVAWSRAEREISLAKSLDRFAEEGVAATYYSCDVSNPSALAETLEKIRRVAPITGVLHGAGIEESTSFEKKRWEIVRRTLAVKAGGAKALATLLEKDPLTHFLALGSIAGRMGSLGQTDYSAANDCLAKILDRLQAERPSVRVSLFHWGPWDEIGMATRPEMRSNPILQQMTFLPPKEGLEYVLEELESPEEPVEKVFMGWDYFQMFYPADNNAPTEEERRAEVATPKESEPTSVKTGAATGWNEPSVPYKLTRWERRCVRLPDYSESDPPFVPKGNAIIYGDNPTATALRAALQRRGATVLTIPESEDHPATLAAIERFWSQGAAPHLFVVSPRSNIAAPTTLANATQRRRENYTAVSWICRTWLKLLTRDNLLGSATLGVATAQGGGFGFSVDEKAPTRSNGAVESAEIAGVAKCVHLENGPASDGVVVRLLDAPDDADPALVAEALLAELTLPDVGIERACVAGRRYAPRVVAVPVRSYPRRAEEPKGVWVVTGGGRGVTARVALGIGKRFGASICLLGTSPAPDAEAISLAELDEGALAARKKLVVRDAMKRGISPDKAWAPIRKGVEIARNLKAMGEAGVKVVYKRCDVLDFGRVAEVLDEIRRELGPIEGLVHGAGIDGVPATVRDVQESQFADDERLTAIKIDAVFNLWELLKQDPLRYFVGFGSISGCFGSASASSYCAANDALCKMIPIFRAERPETRSIAFHWHAWGEVGMMTRPVSFSSVNALKMELMSPDEGVSRVIDELLANSPETEPIVTDRAYFSTFYGPEMELATDAPSASKARAFPLLKSLDATAKQSVGEFLFDPERDPFLIDHRLRDRPLLPAVVAAEAFCETVAALEPSESPFAIGDLTFQNGLTFPKPDPILARVRAERIDATTWRAELCSDFHNSRGKLIAPNRVCSRCVVSTRASSDNASKLALPRSFEDGSNWTSRANWNEVEFYPIQYLPKGAPMWHGPVFQQLRNCAFPGETTGENDAIVWGELVVGSVAKFSGGRSTDWLLPAATIDACLYLCGVSVWRRRDNQIGLPKSLGRLEFGRALKDGEKCRVVCRATRFSSAGATGEETFQFVLFGEDGAPALWGDDYVCQILPSGRA